MTVHLESARSRLQSLDLGDHGQHYVRSGGRNECGISLKLRPLFRVLLASTGIPFADGDKAAPIAAEPQLIAVIVL